MSWKKFDADEVDHQFVESFVKVGYGYLEELSVDTTDVNTVKSYTSDAIEKYNNGEQDELNTIVAVHAFKPDEFTASSEISDSLNEFMHSLGGINRDWRKGSKHIQRYVNEKFDSAGDVTLRGGRERVTLDSLVKIGGLSVAIEYETSTNIDNGYFTLREAIKTGRAHYGVMVVPWSSSHSGRANEAKGIGRLDRDCDGVENPIGPVFSVAVVRLIDIYRHFKNA
ncbi:hypothetical protein [Vibrio gallaecicus]|uniref:Restriction endonuclease n=1 Tax=Vibrio gallaecicus TaxID=552386 RepID=A0ABV4NHR6_9VIBR